MIQAKGDERCSWCELRVMAGHFMLEGDGGELFCSSDCIGECDEAREAGCPSHVRKAEWQRRVTTTTTTEEANR